MANFGLRYERLLMLTAPIAAATLFVLAVSATSRTQDELLHASCYEKTAEAISSRLTILDPAWKQAEPVVGNDAVAKFQYYRKFLEPIEDNLDGCFVRMLDDTGNYIPESPKASADRMRAAAEKLRKLPMRFYGIEVPQVVTTSVAGVALKVPLNTLSVALQLILAPVLLLWLSSLYNTRHREVEEIEKAKTFAAVFPHAINVFPTNPNRTARKRGFATRYVPHMTAALFFLIRILLLTLFIGPPVVSYAASLLFGMDNSHEFVYFGGMAAVLIFGFANWVPELYLAIIMKQFPMSETLKRWYKQ